MAQEYKENGPTSIVHNLDLDTLRNILKRRRKEDYNAVEETTAAAEYILEFVTENCICVY